MGLRLRAPLLTSFPWSVPHFLAGIYDLHTSKIRGEKTLSETYSTDLKLG